MSKFYFFFIFTCLLASCKNLGPHPADMVGNFTVSAKLSDDAMDETEIKSSISEAMEKAKGELAKAKEEINREFDLESIDTSTVEGKIEMAAKKFGKSMAELGTDMGSLGTELGSLFGALTTNGIGFGESILKALKIEVELQTDGNIKTKNSLISMGMDNATWEVSNDYFIIKADKKEKADTFNIIKRNADGFILAKQELELHFTRNNIK